MTKRGKLTALRICPVVSATRLAATPENSDPALIARANRGRAGGASAAAESSAASARAVAAMRTIEPAIARRVSGLSA